LRRVYRLDGAVDAVLARAGYRLLRLDAALIGKDYRGRGHARALRALSGGPPRAAEGWAVTRGAA